MSTDPQTLPIVCSLDEIELKTRREGDIAALLSAVVKSRELPDGYELTLPGDPGTIRKLTEFIINERECCRFFSFDAAFASNAGDITLLLRGPEGTKRLTEMGLTPR
jgi:hypothetical protein